MSSVSSPFLTKVKILLSLPHLLVQSEKLRLVIEESFRAWLASYLLVIFQATIFPSIVVKYFLAFSIRYLIIFARNASVNFLTIHLQQFGTFIFLEQLFSSFVHLLANLTIKVVLSQCLDTRTNYSGRLIVRGSHGHGLYIVSLVENLCLRTLPYKRLEFPNSRTW